MLRNCIEYCRHCVDIWRSYIIATAAYLEQKYFCEPGAVSRLLSGLLAGMFRPNTVVAPRREVFKRFAHTRKRALTDPPKVTPADSVPNRAGPRPGPTPIRLSRA